MVQAIDKTSAAQTPMTSQATNELILINVLKDNFVSMLRKKTTNYTLCQIWPCLSTNAPPLPCGHEKNGYNFSTVKVDHNNYINILCPLL